MYFNRISILSVKMIAASLLPFVAGCHTSGWNEEGPRTPPSRPTISVPQPVSPPAPSPDFNRGDGIAVVAEHLAEWSVLHKMVEEAKKCEEAATKIRDAMKPTDLPQAYVMISRGGSIMEGGTFVGIVKEGTQQLDLQNLYLTKPFSIYPKLPPLQSPFEKQELEEMLKKVEELRKKTEQEHKALEQARLAAAEAEQARLAAKAKADAAAARAAAKEEAAARREESNAQRNGRELQRQINNEIAGYKRAGGPFRGPSGG